MLLGAVLYSNEFGYLGETENVKKLTDLLNHQYQKGRKE